MVDTLTTADQVLVHNTKTQCKLYAHAGNARTHCKCMYHFMHTQNKHVQYVGNTETHCTFLKPCPALIYRAVEVRTCVLDNSRFELHTQMCNYACRVCLAIAYHSWTCLYFHLVRHS